MRNSIGWKLLLSIMLLLSGVLLGCGERATPQTLAWRGDLQLSAPSSIEVGTSLNIAVRAAAPDGTPAELLAVWGYGPRRYTSQFAAGQANFTLPSSDTVQAGAVWLHARVGESVAHGQLTVQPGAIAFLNEPFPAPRSICANFGEYAYPFVILHDRYGNPPHDGSRVRLIAHYPDERRAISELRSRNGLVWARVRGGMLAGNVTLVAHAAGQTSLASVLRVTACYSGEFTLRSTAPEWPISSTLPLSIRTSIIRDPFGNPLSDGSHVIFVVQWPDGSQSNLPALSIGGIASIELYAPTTAGIARIVAVSQGRHSATLSIEFHRRAQE